MTALLSAFSEIDGVGIDFVDVGCRGDVEERWRPLASRLNYVGFDPDGSEVRRLEQSPSAHRRRRYLPYAVGGVDGEAVLYHTESPYNPEFWNRPITQFFETYRRAVNIIRSRIPGATIAGPGYAVYVHPTSGICCKLTDFLAYAKANNVLPNILSWHEIILPDWNYATLPYVGYADFLGRVTTMRNFMTVNGITVKWH